MIWITGLLCFLAGLSIGALVYKQFMSDAARVRLLESKLETLQENHDDYKHSVNSHFEDTALAMKGLTESYREVYRQLVSDARNLCPEDVSNQLSLIPGAKDIMGIDDENTDSDSLSPPRDYASKSDTSHRGSLSEDYGIKKNY